MQEREASPVFTQSHRARDGRLPIATASGENQAGVLQAKQSAGQIPGSELRFTGLAVQTPQDKDGRWTLPLRLSSGYQPKEPKAHYRNGEEVENPSGDRLRTYRNSRAPST